MTDLSQQAKPALEILLQAEPDELFQELGIRFEAMKRNPQLAGSFEVGTDVSEEALGLDDIATDVRAFGRRFFQKVNMDAYKLVCGNDQEGVQDRKQLADAFQLGPEAVAASLAAVFVAQLGLAPAIAAVVAALTVKLFFRNAYSAMCEVWSENQSPKV